MEKRFGLRGEVVDGIKRERERERTEALMGGKGKLSMTGNMPGDDDVVDMGGMTGLEFTDEI